MRIITNTILFISLVFLMSSCEKNSGIETPVNQLKVTEANVTFESQGGEGYIKVNATGAVNATSNEEWCVPSVSGTTINLKAEPNLGMGGRSATITIESGGEKIEVTAVQTAAVMWFKNFRGNTIAFLSEGSTVETDVISSFPITVESKPDWITYKFENDKLYLTAGKSIPRKGSITFSSNGRTITYDIVQVSYAGLLGEWEMQFNNPSQGNRLETTTVVFEMKEDNASFLLKNLIVTGTTEAEIVVDFNPKTNAATISAGQYLMTATDGRLVYLCLRSATGGYTWSSNSQLAGLLDIAADGTVSYTLDDNGTWSAGAKGFGFYLFTGEPPSSATSTGSSYKRFMNIVLIKK